MVTYRSNSTINLSGFTFVLVAAFGTLDCGRCELDVSTDLAEPVDALVIEERTLGALFLIGGACRFRVMRKPEEKPSPKSPTSLSTSLPASSKNSDEMLSYIEVDLGFARQFSSRT